MTVLTRTRDELLDARTTLAEERGESAVVMTMGALHAGHAQLIRVARDVVGRDGSVVVTIFVNPLQFSAGEDLDRYPRTVDADLRLCRAEGVDLVFAPAKEDVYPRGDPQVSIDPGPLGAELEGAARPGHFSGMLTVVAKLLGLTVPSFAVFGEKDYQQLVLVRRMVDDLDLGVEVLAVPTVRDDDGLALSSRNRYLSPAERARALALPLALEAGAAVAHAGAAAVLAAAGAVLERADRVAVDYLALRDPDLFPAPDAGPARLLVAARVGAARLIDNAPVLLGAR